MGTFARKMGFYYDQGFYYNGFYYDQGTQSNLYKPSDGFYYQQEQNGFYYDGFYYDKSDKTKKALDNGVKDGFYYDGFYYDGFYYDKAQKQGFYYDQEKGFYYDEKDSVPAYKPPTGAPAFPTPPRFPAGP